MRSASDIIAIVVFASALVVTVAVPTCGGDTASADDVSAIVARHSAALAPATTVIIHPPWRDDVVPAVRAHVAQTVTVTEAFTIKHGEAWPQAVIVAVDDFPLPSLWRDRVVDTVTDGPVRIMRVRAGR